MQLPTAPYKVTADRNFSCYGALTSRAEVYQVLEGFGQIWKVVWSM